MKSEGDSYDVITELEVLRGVEPGIERLDRLTQLISDALADVALEAEIAVTQFTCLGFDTEVETTASGVWQQLKALAEYHTTEPPTRKRRRTYKAGSKDPWIAVGTTVKLLGIDAVRLNGWYPRPGSQRTGFLDALRALSRTLHDRMPDRPPKERAFVALDRLNRIIVAGQLKHKKSSEVNVCDTAEVERARAWIGSGSCAWTYMDKRSGSSVMLDYSVPLLSADVDALGLVYSAGGILVRALRPRGPLASPQPTHGAHLSSDDSEIANLDQATHSVVGPTAIDAHTTHDGGRSPPDTTHVQQPEHMSAHATSGETGYSAPTKQEFDRRHALRPKSSVTQKAGTHVGQGCRSLRSSKHGRSARGRIQGRSKGLPSKSHPSPIPIAPTMPELRISRAYDLPSVEDFENFDLAKSKLILVIEDMLRTFDNDCACQNLLSHYRSALDWLKASREPSYGRDDLADVLELDDSEMLTALGNDEYSFSQPVVIRMESGSTMGVLDFCSRLYKMRQWNGGLIEVQDRSANLTTHMRTTSLHNAFATELQYETRYDPSHLPINALNLSNHSKKPPPRFIEAERYQLLDFLRMGKRPTAGKQLTEQDSVTDVSGCTEFNILAGKLAYSKPHADLLNGTYIQCLSGLKLWIAVVGITESEWRDFLQHGGDWSAPKNKTVAVLLRPGDTLLMPPGVRVVHAPLTITPCLMQGGMIWDSLALPSILSNMRDICLNPTSTNEDIPHEMQQMLAMLESMEGIPNVAREAVRSFRETVACGCCLNAKGCAETCPCQERESRCTPLCAKHTGARHCLERKQHN